MSAQIINTPEMKLSALRIVLKNHRACLKKLSMARTDRDRGYWAKACEHWDGKIESLFGKSAQPLLSVQTSINEFKSNIAVLRKEVDNLVVDDLMYRFDVIIETLVNDPLQKEEAKHKGLKLEP